MEMCMGTKYDRREFIKKSALASAALAVGSRVDAWAARQPVLVKVSGAGVPKNIAAAVKQVLEPLGGMRAFVKKGQKVLIKPNVGFPTPPEQHATTSPAMLKAVAREVLDCGAAKVLILDNPTRRPEACMRVTGIREAVAGLKNVHFFLPTSQKMYTQTKIPRGKVLKRAEILNDALLVDVHIAVPIAKSHNAAGFTGGLKGMMGLILDRESFHSRFDLNQAIADLNTVLKPHLVIMDALKVMATDGPAGPGELITRNAILAGTGAVAVDAAAVELAPLYGRKIKARQIRHLKIAADMGLGVLKPPANRIVTLEM
jgi:uncharacterized protein (DUF362 family)